MIKFKLQSSISHLLARAHGINLHVKFCKIHPVTSAEYPQVALRPHHAVMSLAKARSTGFVRPDWHEALAKFMADY